jgi:hypothetical protein
MSLEPEEHQPIDQEPNYEQLESAPPASRTTLPGIFLIVVGAVNLLLGGICCFIGYGASQVPTEQLRRELERQQPGNLKAMEEAGWTVQDIQNLYLYGFGIGGCVVIIVGLFIILGGIMMCVRKAYFLAVVASILAAFPVISLSACPCIFGLGIGIWALVVLFSADGKAAFQQANL